MQRPHGDIGIESNAVNGGVVLGRSSDPGDGCAVTKLNIIGQSEAGAIIENHPPVTKRLMRVVRSGVDKSNDLPGTGDAGGIAIGDADIC
jgi:hypothetical protein